MSFGEEFELAAGDADRLLQLRGPDVLWQKERLLNVAVVSLPPECRHVAWLDGDTVFARPDWADEVSRRLERVPLLQPYTRLHHLPRDIAPALFDYDNPHFAQQSLASAAASGRTPGDCLSTAIDRGQGTVAVGFAWAARRELIERHRHYDACIIGGGDTALSCAAYGCFDDVMRIHQMNPMQRDYYLAWARPFSAAVRGEVAAVEGDLLHLWHGDLADRRPRERHAGLRPFEFDPAVDLALADSGSWKWNSDKPALHAYVRDYFGLRNEDGDRVAPP